jgi:hypothetical protein
MRTALIAVASTTLAKPLRLMGRTRRQTAAHGGMAGREGFELSLELGNAVMGAPASWPVQTYSNDPLLGRLVADARG